MNAGNAAKNFGNQGKSPNSKRLRKRFLSLTSLSYESFHFQEYAC